jgi:hyperosmotically inducible protein
MNIVRPLFVASFALALSLPCAPFATAQQPDNSVQNKNQSPTADNQSNAKSDRLLTQQIRKAIIADKTLSTYAHNVKIIVANGSVTLKGPVKSDDEKQKVMSDASSVNGAGNISDQLTVK